VEENGWDWELMKRRIASSKRRMSLATGTKVTSRTTWQLEINNPRGWRNVSKERYDLFKHFSSIHVWGGR